MPGTNSFHQSGVRARENQFAAECLQICIHLHTHICTVVGETRAGVSTPCPHFFALSLFKGFYIAGSKGNVHKCTSSRPKKGTRISSKFIIDFRGVFFGPDVGAFVGGVCLISLPLVISDL